MPSFFTARSHQATPFTIPLVNLRPPMLSPAAASAASIIVSSTSHFSNTNHTAIQQLTPLPQCQLQHWGPTCLWSRTCAAISGPSAGGADPIPAGPKFAADTKLLDGGGEAKNKVVGQRGILCGRIQSAEALSCFQNEGVRSGLGSIFWSGGGYKKNLRRGAEILGSSTRQLKVFCVSF
jgi:hypothetical protein